MQAGHRARERAPGSSREGRNEFTGHQSDWTASGHVAEGSTEEPETTRTHTLPGRLGSGDGVRQWKARGCFRLSEQEYG